MTRGPGGRPYHDIVLPGCGEYPDAPEADIDSPLWTEIPSDLVQLDQTSPRRLRSAVRMMAVYFRREFGWDVVQYDPDEVADARDRFFLFVGRGHFPEPVIGGCAFRWRDYRHSEPSFALQWVWLHPYERRRGRLAEAWPYFRLRFGEFEVEGPVSDAMAGFLEKVGHPPERWKI